MKLLITGGTGLVGTSLSRKLLKKGHEVTYLSRKPKHNALGIKEYAWDVDRETYDPQAFENVDIIINLAGAPINKRWTPEYKSEVLRSRVDGTRLLYKAVQKEKVALKTMISASAVGYYPNDPKLMYSENDAPGSDFLSMVTQKWEQETQNFETLGIRTVRFRIGVVLSTEGGALPAILKPLKLGFGAPLGDGLQWMSWIHIEDLTGIICHLAENENTQGVYNAVAPNPATNEELTKTAAKVLGKPLWLPNVPAAALKLALGEMSTTALASNKVSSYKIENVGYQFKFPRLKEALEDLLN